MKRTTAVAALVFIVMAYTGAVYAQPGSPVTKCGDVEHLARTDSVLARVAAAIKNGHLTAMVVGTASSALPLPAGAQAAYPARLEAALAGRLPQAKIKVLVNTRPKRTAADMAEEFERLVNEEKPELVIWQTGTVDALRGIDPEDFRVALEEGIATLHSGNADVILMNMQYSPRTESMIAGDAYMENMRWVALQREIPLFDRFAIMKQWSEQGTFDLNTASRDFDQARRVHDCIGNLLADFILTAARPAQQAAPHAKGTN